MNSENLTIVVDGGASGCRLAAFDNLGTQRSFALDGPANLSIGEDTAWQHIRQGLSSIAEQMGEPNDWLPQRLWLGLAGSLQSHRREKFLSLIPKEIEPVVITDGHAQLIGAAGGKPGICLAMGTGSVIHWQDTQGKLDHAGGWGYPIGDEGSGAWLGAQLVNHYLWYRDASTNQGNLTNTVTRSINENNSTVFAALEQRIGTEVSDIQRWSTSDSSTKLASLAPIIVDAANHGDELANSIVNSGTHYCQKLIDLAPANLPLFIVGGLADLYTVPLKKLYGDRCQPAKGNALNGLYIFAKEQQGSNV